MAPEVQELAPSREITGTQRTALVVCLFVALFFSWGILTSLGTIEGFRTVYAGSEPYYNLQASALANGQFGLRSDPRSLALDLAWFDGSVQQIWGLGVPAWILLLSVLTAGSPLWFPSRVAFALALWLVSWAVLYRLTVATNRYVRADGRSHTTWDFWIVLFPTVGILLLFPSFCALLKSCFRVYEEACSYSYLFELFLFVLLLRLGERPSARRLGILSLAAGTGAFIRPTVGIYGLSAILAGLFIALRSRLRPSKILVCLLGNIALQSLLLWTNAVRFGSPLEFGHSITVSPHWEYVYPLRFGSPFESEPPGRALKELSGALLFDREFNGGHWLAPDVFRWQSDAPRWRQNYLPAIGWPMILLSILGAAAVFATYRSSSARARTTAGLTLIFAGIAFLGLIIFYARCAVMSSRYLYDFSAVFAVTGAAGWWYFSTSYVKRGLFARSVTTVFAASICFYLCYRAHTALCGEEDVTSCSRAGYKQLLSRMRLNTGIKTRVLTETRCSDFVPGNAANTFQIPYNGSGWLSSEGGRVRVVTSHFLQDIQFLELEISPASASSRAKPELIRAKVGLEELRMERVESPSGDRVRIRFRGPVNPKYRTGIQVVFVAWVPVAEYEQEFSPWLLHSICWRDGP